ncbi:hypothetical protein HID58_034705 [Brassica napus]|uniref:EF hand associated type-2 domain-containing protein n=1 Tax=Brassica napus TaxID=3708 RepID=A0ABQ8C2W7_BRANA|nr:hypothetical protein HID58_034705 [Brassica napus]
MMSGFGLGDSHGSTKLVRIVVVGETRTKKSSLIMAAVTDHNHPDPRIPSMLPYTKLPSEYCFEDVPVTLIDTSLRDSYNNVLWVDKKDVIREVKEANAIVLTFAMDRLETLHCLSEYWLLLLNFLLSYVFSNRFCNFFLLNRSSTCYSIIQKEHNPIDNEEITTAIRRQRREIEICIEWYALRLSDISWLAQAVFVQVQIAAMHPIGPVYDQVTNSLKPRCVVALKHIFELNARDNDYILNDDGSKHVNARCFSIPLMPSRSRALINFVQELCPEGVKENGLTVDGFLVLITKLIIDRKLRPLWTMLRTFGYNNDIRLVDEMIPYSSFKPMHDQNAELTDEAIGSLRRVYHHFDNLEPQMMESLFETAPENSHGLTKPVRIVVVGEKGTRKSITLRNHADPRIPLLLPYTNLPSKYCSEDVLVTLLDSFFEVNVYYDLDAYNNVTWVGLYLNIMGFFSFDVSVNNICRPVEKGDVIREVKQEDAIVLLLETLDRLSEYWLLLFRHLKVQFSFFLMSSSINSSPYRSSTCYSIIQKEHNPIDNEEITIAIRQQFREIEICIEWSASRLSDISWLVQAVFVQAQITAMHPIGPVYDQVTNSLKPRCVSALKHIFEHYACDNDYILSDERLIYINARCFGIPLMPSRSKALIKSVQELCSEGDKENGLTVDGFLVLITKLIIDRKLRTLWTMLRTFGYNNDIRLVDEMIPYSSFKRIPERRVYHRFHNLGSQMMESFFESAPERLNKTSKNRCVGENGTRKSSLIIAAVTGHNHPDPINPPMLPYTNLRSEYFSEDVPVPLIDTFLISVKLTDEAIRSLRRVYNRFDNLGPQMMESLTSPERPVYDQVTNSLKPRCVSALKRIFELYACDNDYTLSEDMLNHINARCFGIPLMPSHSKALIKSVQELCPVGVKENRLTVDDFLSVELTDGALGSLRRVYHRFDNLGPQMMKSFFETAPER